MLQGPLSEVFKPLERAQRKPQETRVGISQEILTEGCLLYTSPSPRDLSTSRMPSSA